MVHAWQTNQSRLDKDSMVGNNDWDELLNSAPYFDGRGNSSPNSSRSIMRQLGSLKRFKWLALSVFATVILGVHFIGESIADSAILKYDISSHIPDPLLYDETNTVIPPIQTISKMNLDDDEGLGTEIVGDGYSPQTEVNMNFESENMDTETDEERNDDDKEQDDKKDLDVKIVNTAPLPWPNLHPLSVNSIAVGSRKAKFTYLYYRTIGNDLPPRHGIGQTYENVKFILENEKEFENVEKRWIVNRIARREEEVKVLGLLDEHKQTYIHIPIVLEDYAKIPMWYDLLANTKDILRNPLNLYVMHNNGARNVMLTDGIESGAKWILPFDGNCFMTEKAWTLIANGIKKFGKDNKYFTVPMVRLLSNDDLFDPEFEPNAKEEPQIIFRNDSKERFNENMRYGRRPKVEMLWRLRVPGPWDKWPQRAGVWEKPTWKKTEDGPTMNHPVPEIGWIPRLFSGAGKLEVEGALRNRGLSRTKGVEILINYLDEQVARLRYGFAWDRLVSYNETILGYEKVAYINKSNKALTKLIDGMVELANIAVEVGSFTVMNKSEFPPSGDKHDYYSPSPYFWPNPNSTDGLPYIRKDGDRVPGSLLWDEFSERYDRSRLASMFHNTTILALSWFFTDDIKYASQGAENVRVWFLNEETRMSPTMMYAQIRWGWDDNVGANYGIIETKDLYFLLDAVRLFYKSGEFSDDEVSCLKKWLHQFATYLIESDQGTKEYRSFNNHGTYFDVQLASIAAFLDDVPLMLNYTQRTEARMLTQFKHGVMPKEMERPTSLHYMMFGLQGWMTIATIANNIGIDLWNYSHRDSGPNPCIQDCAVFTNPFLNNSWSHKQENDENMERMYPPYYKALTIYGDTLKNNVPAPKYKNIKPIYEVNGYFCPHFGIQPYWNLGLTMTYIDDNTEN
eukprot:CFRG0984T1